MSSSVIPYIKYIIIPSIQMVVTMIAMMIKITIVMRSGVHSQSVLFVTVFTDSFGICF